MLLSGSAFAAAGGTAHGGPLAAAERVQAASDLRLEADLSERKLLVHHGGRVVESYDIAVGDPEHPTPQGSFTIEKLIWDPAWVPPPNAEWAQGETRKAPDDPDNPMEAAKIFFKEPDYYVHGTDATHTLGQAESHGCLRMAPDDVERLAELVQEHGGEHRSDAWYERVKRQDSEKHTIHLSDPVPFDVHE